MSDSPLESGDDRLGEIHRVLANPTRRSLVCVLRGTDVATLGTIAAELVEADGTERSGSSGIGTVEGTARVEAMLHHVHLPMLSALGAVDYDPATGTVETNDEVDVIHDALLLHPMERCE